MYIVVISLETAASLFCSLLLWLSPVLSMSTTWRHNIMVQQQKTKTMWVPAKIWSPIMVGLVPCPSFFPHPSLRESNPAQLNYIKLWLYKWSNLQFLVTVSNLTTDGWSIEFSNASPWFVRQFSFRCVSFRKFYLHGSRGSTSSRQKQKHNPVFV